MSAVLDNPVAIARFRLSAVRSAVSLKVNGMEFGQKLPTLRALNHQYQMEARNFKDLLADLDGLVQEAIDGEAEYVESPNGNGAVLIWPAGTCDRLTAEAEAKQAQEGA